MLLNRDETSLTSSIELQTSGAMEDHSMPILRSNPQHAKDVPLVGADTSPEMVENGSDSDEHASPLPAQQNSAGRKARKRRHKKGERNKSPERAPSPPKRNPYLDLEAGLEFNVS